MKGMTHETKVQVKKKNIHRTAENSPAKVQVSRGGIIVLVAIPTLIGIWAAACFIGGLITSNGTIAMAKSWFSALTLM